MKGTGRGIQRLERNVIDLFPSSLSCSRQVKPSRWMDVNTHTYAVTKMQLCNLYKCSEDYVFIKVCSCQQQTSTLDCGYAKPWECKTSEASSIFRARKFCLLIKKSHWIYKFSVEKIKNGKITVNFKYYREHHRTCKILVFIYLMASKLLYLLMDQETFN